MRNPGKTLLRWAWPTFTHISELSHLSVSDPPLQPLQCLASWISNNLNHSPCCGHCIRWSAKPPKDKNSCARPMEVFCALDHCKIFVNLLDDDHRNKNRVQLAGVIKLLTKYHFLLLIKPVIKVNKCFGFLQWISHDSGVTSIGPYLVHKWPKSWLLKSFVMEEIKQ